MSDVAAMAAAGKALRKVLPRSRHGEWWPAPDRPDPVALIEEQNADRLEWLVPVRRARMAESAFAFYRGSARIMATDLASTPQSGLTVQLCGDAHLANFGLYASPERKLMFDLNDFDETLPGPFEWDVKRLAASFTIAGQHRGWKPRKCREPAVAVTRAYREAMHNAASRGYLDMWYASLPVEDLIALRKSQGATKKQLKHGKKAAKKARSKDHLQAAGKLVQKGEDGYRFKSQPPLLVPFRDLPLEMDQARRWAAIEEALASYRSSLSGQMRVLLDRYTLVDVAVKVVGVGSVGTRCWVGLFLGRDPSDVLLLQIKEAGRSVLEEHLPRSRFHRYGRRVVDGQRMMQATSDIFLGWSKTTTGREYYWRQLKDWKGSLDLETVPRAALLRYAELCGATLARAHAVSGDPAAIAAYLGNGDVFDEAIGDFAEAYAKQNSADYAMFAEAIGGGALDSHEVES